MYALHLQEHYIKLPALVGRASGDKYPRDGSILEGVLVFTVQYFLPRKNILSTLPNQVPAKFQSNIYPY